MSYIKEIGYQDTAQFRKEADEYWAPSRVTIDSSEYDTLVEDQQILMKIEEALIDFISGRTSSVSLTNMVSPLTEGLRKAAGYDETKKE